VFSFVDCLPVAVSLSLSLSLSQDWTKWKDDSDDHSADDIYSSPTDQKHVKTVDTAGFEQALKDSSVVFVDASLPWCTKCSFTRKAFTAAARQLGGSKTTYGAKKPVSFVYVNTREVREAARTFNVSCDFPCKFYVVRDNALDKAEDVEAKGQESDIVSAIESRLSPLMTKVTNEQEAQDFSKLHAVSCLVSLQGGVMSSPEASAEYKAAEEAAKVLRGKVAVMYTDKGIGGLKAPGAQAWVNSSTPRAVELSTNSSTFARNLVAMTWGFSMFNYTWSKRELFDAVGLPIAHAFLDDTPSPGECECERERERESE
jgi:thiol-disulfide isomerase/thioredoxin